MAVFHLHRAVLHRARPALVRRGRKAFARAVVRHRASRSAASRSRSPTASCTAIRTHIDAAGYRGRCARRPGRPLVGRDDGRRARVVARACKREQDAVLSAGGIGGAVAGARGRARPDACRRGHAARAREPRVSGDRRRVHQLFDVVLAADALHGVAALGVLVPDADLRCHLRRAAAGRALHAALHGRRGDGARRASRSSTNPRAAPRNSGSRGGSRPARASQIPPRALPRRAARDRSRAHRNPPCRDTPPACCASSCDAARTRPARLRRARVHRRPAIRAARTESSARSRNSPSAAD